MERGKAAAAMSWSERNRDVQLARKQSDQLLRTGNLHCVWSGKSLSSRNLDMDHCFPWSAWPCPDLWNLMPTNRVVNQKEKAVSPKGALCRVSLSDALTEWLSKVLLARSARSHRRIGRFALTSFDTRVRRERSRSLTVRICPARTMTTPATGGRSGRSRRP